MVGHLTPATTQSLANGVSILVQGQLDISLGQSPHMLLQVGHRSKILLRQQISYRIVKLGFLQLLSMLLD